MKEEEEKKEEVINLGKTEQESEGATEIEQAFTDSIDYEEISEVEESPINEAVKEGEVSDGFLQLGEAKKEVNNSDQENDQEMELPSGLLEEIEEEQLPPSDAPEQRIDDTSEEDSHEEGEEQSDKPELDVPNGHAALAADSLLGVADNVLEIGGGFFVKMKKTKSILDFDELIEIKGDKSATKLSEVIDQKNVKNILRIKLDKEDKALLRPILIEVLKRKAEELTPEQQLMAVGISIAIKKAQLMVEIKAENKILLQQLDSKIDRYMQRLEEEDAKDEESAGEKGYQVINMEDENEEGNNEEKEAA